MKTPAHSSVHPTLFVIFGITGDLATRKLIPALFAVWQRTMVPKQFAVVGFSRQKLNQEAIRSRVKSILAATGGTDSHSVHSFAQVFDYVEGFFDTPEGYHRLGQKLGSIDEQWGVCTNKLFHLAVPPNHYEQVFTHLAASGLTIPCSNNEGWTRVIVEKPFGSSLESAKRLEAMLGNLFQEEQIYRIDHYLGKETVQNILAFRFSNTLFEPAWNNDSIERIEIALRERATIEGRGAFYDAVGALRDVGQNHLLQLLALFTMDNPGGFDAVSVRRARQNILELLEPMTQDHVGQYTVRAQYEGYLQEKQVKADSSTETYFRIKAYLNHPRWKGVPMYLESGKVLGENSAYVRVLFRHRTPCLCPAGGPHVQNVLTYQLQPKELISSSFWVKRPGPTMTIEEQDFTFSYSDKYDPASFLQAYEKLILDAIDGNQTLFVSTQEIRASWMFIDPIVRAWQTSDQKLLTYTRFVQPNGLVADDISTLKKNIGIIGAGKMGRGIAEQLREKGWQVLLYDPNESVRKNLYREGFVVASSISELCQALPKPRLVWMMVPALAVEAAVAELKTQLSAGDYIIDGGNSFFSDSKKRAFSLRRAGIHYLDVGVSGGPSGARHGACLMIGGDKNDAENLRQLFEVIALPGGWEYCGEAGAGHFVKMVHNGIEYGMMQAIGEGFAVLKKSSYRLTLHSVAGLYNRGSVIASRLVGWLEQAFFNYGDDLKKVSGSIAHTGEGEWTVKTAKKMNIPVPVIEKSFQFRVRSAKSPSYTGKIVSALRNKFGGHDVSKK